jgi:hypothetical protein
VLKNIRSHQRSQKEPQNLASLRAAAYRIPKTETVQTKNNQQAHRNSQPRIDEFNTTNIHNLTLKYPT